MAKCLDKAGLERLWDLFTTKLAAKQNKLKGQPGQVVGFNATGNAIAQDALTMDMVNAAIGAAVAGAIEEVY